MSENEMVRWENRFNTSINGECSRKEYDRFANSTLGRGKFRIVESKTVPDPPEAIEANEEKKEEVKEPSKPKKSKTSKDKK